jgi:glycine/D-amino acid oxidase-like deaminating enzyme
MNLKSARPYWPTTSRRPAFTPVQQPKFGVDALIIGAGITGALCAYELSKAGASVAIIDRRPVASGSTPASTALLQYEIDTPLVKLSGLLGQPHARAAYSASRQALHDIANICREIDGDIDLIPRLSLHLAVKPGDMRTFKDEVAARTAIGIPVQVLSRKALASRFNLHRPGAILSDEAFEVNPLKLTYHVLCAARQRGAIVLPRTSLDTSCLIRSARPFQIDLRGGGTITAERIVIATGYETIKEFDEVARLSELRSSYALATTPVKHEPWPHSALLWDSGDPYFYARTTPDGRIMVGGEDEPYTTPAARDALIAPKSRLLMKKLRDLIPSSRVRPDFRWAGTFAQTKDGLPYIGEHRRWPGVSFALGYGGNGITFSIIAAKIIAAAATGHKHKSAGLFCFDR